MSLYFEPITENQYLDHYFEVKINIRLDNAELSGTDIPLTISARYEGGGIPEPSLNIITVDPRTPAIIRAGAITVAVRVMFNLLSMQCENKRFVLYATASPPGSSGGGNTPTGMTGSGSGGTYVSPAFSTPIRCVRHMLDVSEDLPQVWFKDEGGRDRCMDVTVRLLNGAGHLVTDRRVPLRLVLRYRNGNDVLQQDLLKVSPDCRRFIDETGSTTIKFRIEDVSKNHQKQPFGIWIGPDTVTAPQTADVGAAITNYVDIKSKRNKRKGEDEVSYPSGFQVVKRPALYMDGGDGGDTVLSAATMASGSVPLPGGAPGSVKGGHRISNVYRWAAEVQTRLEKMMWKTCRHDPDTNQPIFEILNPNDSIQQLLMASRSLGVMETLAALCREEGGGAAQQQQQEGAAGGGGSGGGGGTWGDLLGSADALGPHSSGSRPPDDFMHAFPPDNTVFGRQHSLSGADTLLGGMSTMRRMPPLLQRQGSLDDVYNLFGREPKPVNGILAVNFVSKGGHNFGVPAFDALSKLAGFYQYHDNGTSATFCPVDDCYDQGILSAEDETAVYALLNKERANYYLTMQHSGDHSKDLEALVERALTIMWGNTVNV